VANFDLSEEGLLRPHTRCRGLDLDGDAAMIRGTPHHWAIHRHDPDPVDEIGGDIAIVDLPHETLRRGVEGWHVQTVGRQLGGMRVSLQLVWCLGSGEVQTQRDQASEHGRIPSDEFAP
jgi:hypothetical protein